MPRQIWNEGRVVGYSAYEVYVKHALSVDPDHEPATEKEWLASMMAMGSSMLLRIGVDPVGLAYDGLHYRDIQFPEDSRLCAANIIMASFFDGEGYVGTVSPSDDLTGWATKVTSYGSLINNNSTSYPSGTIDTDGTVPPTGIKAITNTTIVPRIKEYMKIVDGIIIQPGTWTDNPNTPPQKDFKPTLSKYPRLRIAFSERITTPFFLLLTGFTNRTVVDGTTGFDTAVNTLSPSDGDFLGPWAFPWSAKVIFSVPSSFINYFMNNNYTRKLPDEAGSPVIAVKSDAIIDLKQNHDDNNYVSDYYKNEDNSSMLKAEITELNTLGDDAAIFATYMHSDTVGNGSSAETTYLPPALYAALANKIGTKYFEPVDTVAPGSLHLYHGEIDPLSYAKAEEATKATRKALTMEEQAKGTTSFMRSKDDYVIYEINEAYNVVPVAKVNNTSLYNVLTLSELSNPMFTVEGTFPSDNVKVRIGDISDTSSEGTDPPEGFNPFESENDGKWYIIVDGNKRVSGTVVKQDPLPYSTPFISMYKRLTGRLSSKIQNQCGYEYDKSTGLLKSGGIWDSATMDMVNQIPESERNNYYYIILGTPYRQNNSAPTPVKKGTHVVDVVMKYTFRILATVETTDSSGNTVKNLRAWAVPSFVNDASAKKSSKYLGTWWSSGASGWNSEKTSATTYSNNWAYIHIPNVYHPVISSRLPETSSAQIYQKEAFLPVDGTSNKLMTDIFTESELQTAGIHADYWNYTVDKFLRTALYTDMGTKQLLNPDNSNKEYENIRQPLCLYTNGWDGTKFDASKQTKIADLVVNNTAANSGMTQLITLDQSLQDSNSTDPQGVIIQTGNLQKLVLSMSDVTNTPYSIYGTDGKVSLPQDNFTWETLLYALTHNLTIDVLGDGLKGLKTAFKSISNGTYQIQVTDGKVSLKKI